MNTPPITTPASPSLASPLTDAAFDSIETLTTSFATSAEPTLETTTVTEVALGYHRNQQYSITAMTTSTGAVAERYAYTAYGQPTILNANGSVLTNSAVGNRYMYTGREWDETLGLHHFRARWMSPLAGRFLGRDPIGYEGSPFGLAEFMYSQPLIRIDPSGNLSPLVILIPLIPLLSGCAKTEADLVSPDRCCVEAKKQVPSNAVGATVCCNGSKVSCYLGAKKDPEADPVLLECITKHEDTHHDDIEACPQDGITVLPFKNGANIDQEECKAYEVELKCLERSLVPQPPFVNAKCKSPRCRTIVQARINFIKNDVKKNYKCTNF